MAGSSTPSAAQFPAAKLKNWDDLEAREGDDGPGHSVEFVAWDGDTDTPYFGSVRGKTRADLTLAEVAAVLRPIPDADVFPPWTESTRAGAGVRAEEEVDTESESNGLGRQHSGPPRPEDPTAASTTPPLRKAPQDVAPSRYFIKRPAVCLYGVFGEYNVLPLIPTGLLEEAHTMEELAKHPHPNIVRCHGCRVVRGRIVGLVLDRYAEDLESYAKRRVACLSPPPPPPPPPAPPPSSEDPRKPAAPGQRGPVKLRDRRAFADALASAVRHLHSIGWAHNDLNPSNVMVAGVREGGEAPVLVDFGSARRIGEELGQSRGRSGWILGEMKDYNMSRAENDLHGLERIREWLEKPTFDDEDEKFRIK